MDRETFDRIMKEEGIAGVSLRNDIWNAKPAADISENELRQTARKFMMEESPSLLVTKALYAAMDREYNRG